MAAIQVGVLNVSMILEKRMAEVEAAVTALQKQVTDHLAPIWGRNADLTLVRRDDLRNYPDLGECQGWWWLLLLTNSDRAENLGYRDLTYDNMPLGKVFVETAEAEGRAWTVTASHELLEMLIDPTFNLSAFKETSANTGMFYSYDICDPCQEESYEIDRVEVSNFVYPTWFESLGHPTGTQFDYRHKITESFQLLPGGYINVLNMPMDPADPGWRQLERPSTGSKVFNPQPLPGSRRERRGRRMSGHQPRPSNAPPVPLSFG